MGKPIHEANGLHRFDKMGAYVYFWIQKKTLWRPEVHFCRNCGMHQARVSQADEPCPAAIPMTIGGL